MDQITNEKPGIWSARESLLVLVAYSAGGFLFPYILKLMLELLLIQPQPDIEQSSTWLFPHVLAGGYLLSSFFLFGLLYWSVVVIHRQNIRDILRLRFPTLVNMAAAIGIAVVLLVVFYLVAFFFEPEGVISPAMKLLNYGAAGMIWFVLVVIIVGPLTEELLFRGYLYAGLKTSWGGGGAVFIVSILFAAMHLPKSFLVFSALFCYSLAFIYLLEKSKSLISPIICHMVINSSALVIYLLLRLLYDITYQF